MFLGRCKKSSNAILYKKTLKSAYFSEKTILKTRLGKKKPKFRFSRTIDDSGSFSKIKKIFFSTKNHWNYD